MAKTSLTQSTPHAAIIALSEDLLSAKFGQPLSLNIIAPIQVEGRFLILRCQVEPSPKGIPESIIIKQMSTDPASHKRIETSQTSRNEQAVLQMMTNLSSSAKPGPIYYSSDPLTGLLIFEDLGDYPTLQDVLYGQDFHQAKEAVVQYGHYLAKMQLAARNQVEIYTTNLRGLGGRQLRDVLGWDLRDYLSDLRAYLGFFKIEVSDEFDQAIHNLAQSIQSPGPFYTLSHCDAGPHNIMILPDQPILIDFEQACFQHGFVDLVQARMAFPTAGLGCRSSPIVIEQMERVYRDELVKHIPEVADDQLYERALVEACAQTVMTMFVEMGQGGLAQFLDTNKSIPTANFRIQRMITFLHAFLQAAESLNQLPYIRMIGQKIYDSILDCCPEVEMLPYFPVFQPASEE